MFRITTFIILVAGILAIVPAAPHARAQQEQSEPFQNVQILTDIPGDELRYIMQVTSRTLGVRCEHCHDRAGWHLDDKPEKHTARDMMRMVAVAGEEYFQGFEAASCWTCHRGSTKPETEVDPEMMAMVRAMPATAFSDETRPAGEVYENLHQLGDIPANELREVMYTFVASLGVCCTHCHTPGDWSSDDQIQKLMARRMIEIRAGLQDDFFDGREVLTCWTCHRGEPRAQTNVPRELLPPRPQKWKK